MQRERPLAHYSIEGQLFTAPPLSAGLYIVATPIGNLADITLRALRVLAAADIVACEDTRVSRVLLERFSIKQKLFSYHEHNAEKSGTYLLSLLQQNAAVALISDAGTPLVSDPGFRLVQKAQKAKVNIIPVPGACAAIAGLVASGLPTDEFMFTGFLPNKEQARQKKIKSFSQAKPTLIFYESAFRIKQTLHDMQEVFGPHRAAALCRELTKAFETIYTGTLEEIALYIEKTSSLRGEIVLLVSGINEDEGGYAQEKIDEMLRQAVKMSSPSQAAKEVAAIIGEKREKLFQRLLFLKNSDAL